MSVSAAVGCGDPLRNESIDALGPERRDVPAGPLHRPGQPCLRCHDDSGNASAMVAAGTVFRGIDDFTPAQNVDVMLIDSVGRVAVAGTNCAGNFFLHRGDFDPVLPLWTTLRFGERVIDMESPLNKNGDCAACHAEPVSQASAGHVYMEFDAERASEIPFPDCEAAR